MKIRNCREICVFAFCMAMVTPSRAQTFTVLKRFTGTNGAIPLAPLVQGLDGNLYGATEEGGDNNEGTVFRITPTGALTTLYRFCAAAGCPDGSGPLGGLVLSPNGVFYGMTGTGGTNSLGTVFQITRSGALTTLYNFCAFANCPDGARPHSALVRGADGIFYGTTYQGGDAGYGSIFEITASGSLTTLHSFCTSAGCADGAFPETDLVQGTDLNFYGITGTFGAHNAGTVFQMTSGGGLTTLYAFCDLANCDDGAEPFTGVVQGADGNFYGTTSLGGTSTNCTSGCGTLFKITPAGLLTTLHSFSASDGAIPVGLVQASDGNFYGTTETGGAYNKGTIFQITPGGAFTTLHSFAAADGTQPTCAPLQGTDGNFYGTTASGGSGNHGTVFKLSMGLAPFVKTLPIAGTVRSAVKILGTDLTGATSVTFNGVPAHFTVVSATEISTSVPSGASTGQVQVATPAGMLTSNPSFQVLP